jgi:hypothetical protein
VAGYILLLVPAGIVLFGVYVLDIAFWARTTYLLGRENFVGSRQALFGRKSLEIARPSVRNNHAELLAARAVIADERAG